MRSLAFAVAIAGITFAIRAFEGPRDRTSADHAGARNRSMASSRTRASDSRRSSGRSIPTAAIGPWVHVDVPGSSQGPELVSGRHTHRLRRELVRRPPPRRAATSISTFQTPMAPIPSASRSEKVDHNPVWSPRRHEDRLPARVERAWRNLGHERRRFGPPSVDGCRGVRTIFPSWSPDGTKIAFVSFDGSNSRHLRDERRRLGRPPAH